MTSFLAALNTRCPDCNTAAQLHRLTPAGHLYCLKLKPSKSWGQPTYAEAIKTRPSLLDSRIPVNQMVRSSLDPDIGRAINKGFNSYA